MHDRPHTPIRVAAVPAAHAYVQAVAPTDGSVVVLPDPIVDPSHPERWWPPAVLDPAWIRAHADDIDLVHVHFGMESLPEGRLEAALDACDAAALPIVLTVHDLENPQLTDQARHVHDLDAIVPRAAALVTLTSAAAAHVRERWGREALVVPHPTLLDAPPPALAPRLGAFTIGMHLRDLRPGIAAVPSVGALLAALQHLRSAGIPAAGRVWMHDRTRDAAVADAVAHLVGDRADCTLVRGPRPDDPALLDQVDALDVSWLPYGHGTHSGWVELCHDRGVPVVGPGWLPMAEQHVDDYHGFASLDESAPAVQEAIASGTRPGTAERIALVAERTHRRRLERKAARDAHAALYRDLVPESRP